jgi:hypothetical protein
MWQWLEFHRVLCGWLFAASAVMFVGSLIAVPWLIVRIPSDYFVRQRHYVDRWQPSHPWLRILFLAAKNFVGVVLLLAGIIMLFTPGQGLLTILVGLIFLDFPGKFALERRLIACPAVFRAVNWMRVKAGRSPLDFPEGGGN